MMVWLAIANSYAMDFLARKKVSLSMTYTILDSLPFPRLDNNNVRTNELIPRCLRLTCTAPEMITFWNKCVADGSISGFKTSTEILGEVNEEARLQILAEIDAIVAREVFDLSRSEVEYILATFPTQQRYQEEKYGEFRSQRLILEAYDSLTEAANTGQPYRSPSTLQTCTSVAVQDGWSLNQLADGQLPESHFTLVVNESEVGKAVPKRWRAVRASETDGLPAQDSWVLVRHPDLKRGNTAVPVAIGKLTYQELTEASTKKKIMAVTLRGPVPPAQVRIPLEDWPTFRPFAVLEPLDS